MIEIWEPRYRDKTVLLADYRLRAGEGADIKITKGYYAGNYKVDSETIANAERETMKTKKGGEITVVIVPLEKLVKEEDGKGE